MEPNTYYHVYNRANGYERLFHSDENYHYFIAKCIKYLPEVCNLYAFALLPNHFHLLVKTLPRDKKRISQVFSNLFNSYTKSFNKYYRRHGALFCSHFKKSQIDSLEYLRNCVLYLHHNAVHHNLCYRPDEWPHTSHLTILGEQNDPLAIELLSWFGGRANYLVAFNNYKAPPQEGQFYFE